MYFCTSEQNLWCNLLTFFVGKKIKNKYLKNFCPQFCSFKNFKGFYTLIYSLKADSNRIFSNWKFKSRSFLKTPSFSNCNGYQRFNNFLCSKYKIKKKNSWNGIRFSPKFLNLVSELLKLMLFTIIYRKIDLYRKKTSSKHYKNYTKIFVRNDVFLIKKLTEKLTKMKVLAKLERFGFLKIEKKEIKKNFLIFFPKKFSFLKLSKLNVFKRMSKFVFSHPFR